MNIYYIVINSYKNDQVGEKLIPYLSYSVPSVIRALATHFIELILEIMPDFRINDGIKLECIFEHFYYYH